MVTAKLLTHLLLLKHITKANGIKENFTIMVLANLKMETNTLGVINLVRRKERADLFFHQVKCMKVSGLMGNRMEKVFYILKTVK